MRRSLLVIVFFAIVSFSGMAFASDGAPDVQVDPDNSGYYYETVIEDEPLPLNLHRRLMASKSKTVKKKSKTTYYKSSSGSVMWYVKVIGTFKYGGGTATCTKSSVKAVSKDPAWTVHDKAASKSGNTATAKATGKKHFQGMVVDTVRKAVTLSCSPSGKFT